MVFVNPVTYIGKKKELLERKRDENKSKTDLSLRTLYRVRSEKKLPSRIN